MDERDLRHISFEGTNPLPRHRPRSHPASADPLTPHSIAAGRDTDAALARWILTRAGLDGNAYRAESLRRRIPACLRALKVRSEDEARRRIADRPALLPVAVDTLLIGVTEFFRDPDVFETLRRHVLPALAACRPLRVWSAGCASGAELYTVAGLLADAGLLDGALLLGTDCRADAIREARDGTVSAPPNSIPSEALLRNHFVALSPGRWQPANRIRERIQWRLGDVLRGAEPGPWHLILWRNVAIYLDPGPAAEVCDRVSAELAAGGFLVLGKAERPAGLPDMLPAGRCIYRKCGA